MSTSVHDILGAIGDAQRALQAEPQYQSHISELQKQLAEAQRHSQALELNINGYKDNIDNLQSKVRSLEVERDDTGFRLLEAEDKLDKLVKVIRACQSSLAIAVDAVDPAGSLFEADFQSRVKREGLAKPEPITPQATISPSVQEPVVTHGAETGRFTSPSPNHEEVQQGSQSEPHPTVQLTESQSPNAGSAEQQENVTTHKPYAGKRYREVSGYVRYDDWIAGGGTNESYYN